MSLVGSDVDENYGPIGSKVVVITPLELVLQETMS
jgi:hypothetical protein